MIKISTKNNYIEIYYDILILIAISKYKISNENYIKSIKN